MGLIVVLILDCVSTGFIVALIVDCLLHWFNRFVDVALCVARALSCC